MGILEYWADIEDKKNLSKKQRSELHRLSMQEIESSESIQAIEELAMLLNQKGPALLEDQSK